MELDAELKQSLQEDLHDEINSIFFCSWIDKINRKGNYNHRLLVFTELRASLYKSKAFSRSLVLSRSFTWKTLHRIDSPESNVLMLYFTDGSISVKDESCKKIIDSLLTYLHDIFIPSEMPELTAKITKIYQPSPSASLKRFNFICASRKHQPSEVLVRSFEDLVNKHGNILDITTLSGLEDNTDLVYDALQNDPTLDTIVVQPSEDGLDWHPLAVFFAKNTTIKHLVIYEPVAKPISHLIKSFLSNDQCGLESYSLFQPKLVSDNLRYISKLLRAHPIKDFSLSCPLPKPRVMELAKILEVSVTLPKLHSFSLTGTESFDVAPLISSLKSVSTLKLVGCDLELNHLFEAFSSTTDLQIHEIDFSDNHSAKILAVKNVIPHSLGILTLKNVDFKGRNLQNLFKIIKDSGVAEGSLELDLSNVTVEEGRWEQFAEGVRLYKMPYISKLVWDGNPLYVDFICCVHYMKKLRKFSINGCLRPNDPMLDTIVEFIKTNRWVSDLSIRAKEGSELGPSDVKKIFGALNINRVIKSIDISGNKINDEILIYLAPIMMANRKVTNIISEKSFNVGKTSLFKFVRNLRRRGYQLDVTWPANEVKGLVLHNQMTEGEEKDLKASWDELKVRDQNIKRPLSSFKKGDIIPPSYGRKKLSEIKKKEGEMPRAGSMDQIEDDDDDSSSFSTNNDDGSNGIEIVVPEIEKVSIEKIVEGLTVSMSIPILTQRLLVSLRAN